MKAPLFEFPSYQYEVSDWEFKKKEVKEYYYHQIFFHYVLADGMRSHCAWDKAR